MGRGVERVGRVIVNTTFFSPEGLTVKRKHRMLVQKEYCC